MCDPKNVHRCKLHPRSRAVLDVVVCGLGFVVLKLVFRVAVLELGLVPLGLGFMV